MAADDKAKGPLAAVAGKWVWFVALGVVLLVASAVVFSNVVATTLVSTIIIGASLVVSGVFHVIQAFATKNWRSFLFNLFSGLLYGAGGFLIMREPVRGSVLITLLLLVTLAVSGAMRIGIALAHRDVPGWWLILIGGLVSIAVGVLLYLQLPWSGLWVLGTLIGVELAVQGFSWLVFGFGLNRARALVHARA